MSEYEYYEFQAIDRPLSQNDIAELRRYSTRARITPTSFVNDYSWGRFKGDENAWMEKYFDAFLYLSNWGSRVFKLRLPLRLIDVQLAREYVVADDEFTFWEKDGSVILSFHVGDDDGPGWVEEGKGSLGSSFRFETSWHVVICEPSIWLGFRPRSSLATTILSSRRCLGVSPI